MIIRLAAAYLGDVLNGLEGVALHIVGRQGVWPRRRTLQRRQGDRFERTRVVRRLSQRTDPGYSPRNMGASFWRDKTVLVTGGTGMIGAQVAKRLVEAGARVSVATRTGRSATWDELLGEAPIDVATVICVTRRSRVRAPRGRRWCSTSRRKSPGSLTMRATPAR
jgi:hypothetical protein